MTVRVAINGFGRTGRSFLRAAIALHPEIEIVAINDLGASEALARLFSRDSVHGRYADPVRVEGESMFVGDRQIRMLAVPSAKDLPWGELQIDVVAESSGRYTKREKAAEHLVAGAKRVVISSMRHCISSSPTHRAPQTVSLRSPRSSTTRSASTTAS